MRIAIFYRHFPVAMGQYIKWGLEEAGHEVYSCGPYSNGKIPWGDQFYYPEYKFPPDLITPDTKEVPIKDVLKSIRKDGFEPKIIIQAADNYFLPGKADIKNILIGTDPHAVDYEPYIQDVDYYVCMQKHYIPKKMKNAVWMPYAYDKNIHQYKPDRIKYDVVFCGLQYPQRVEVLKKIADKGWRVFNKLGVIYEEYTKVYNQGLIAFNYSSKQDLPARFWEGLAMKRCVLTNRVPDLNEFNFEEGIDYLGFDSIEEAVEKADFYLKKPELLFKIASNGYKRVRHRWKNTWSSRVRKMLKEIK